MKRGAFESLVRRHLDATLRPRGFTLTPQPPHDHEDARPAVVHEADPVDCARRYPALAARWDVDPSCDAGCIDLWLHLDREAGRLSCDLEGDGLPVLLAGAGADGELGRLADAPDGDFDAQLVAIAAGLGAVLDAAGG